MRVVYPAKQTITVSPNQGSTQDHDFDKLNLTTRICCHFAPRRDDENTCVCNRPKYLHTDQEPHRSWHMTRNTRQVPDAKKGYWSNGAQFVHMALDTSVKKTEQVLLKTWKIEEPRLVMSIVGGAKYLHLQDRVKASFTKGILHVANKSDAWLFTNAFKAGIAHLVGQAISTHKFTQPAKRIPVIGICKWGCVSGRRSEENPRKQEQQRTKSSTEDDMNEKESDYGNYELEGNHTHYLMLDDGTLYNRDTGDYRTRLVSHIGRLRKENSFAIPTVTVVVEGNAETIADIYHDLKAGIPVVIIAGTGGVADLFSKWLILTKKLDKLANDPKFRTPHDVFELGERNQSSATEDGAVENPTVSQDNVRGKLFCDQSMIELRKIFSEYKYESKLKKDMENMQLFDDTRHGNSKDKINENEFDVLLRRIIYCLQPAVRTYISIFDLNSDNNLFEIIFRSICYVRQKGLQEKIMLQKDRLEQNYHRDQQPLTTTMVRTASDAHGRLHLSEENTLRTQLLHLTMDWNYIDVAKELIFQNSLKNVKAVNEMFLRALKENLPAFVNEFLRLGIDLNEVVQDRDEFLTGLYGQPVGKVPTELHAFIPGEENATAKGIRKIDTLNNVLTDLIGNYMRELYSIEDKQEKRRRSELDQNESGPASPLDRSSVTQQSPDNIMRDLFLWSVLMHHIDMAKVLLSHMKYRICPALIAVKILKKYQEKAGYEDIRTNYRKSIEYFEQYAIDCLDHCDDYDREKACEIILHQNELYGGVTCLQVAASARAKLFIATPCCVQAMNDIWFDRIQPVDSMKRILSLIFSLLTLGALAPLVIDFREDQEGHGGQSHERRLDKVGITYSDPYVPKYSRSCMDVLNSRYLRRLRYFHRSLYVKFCYHWISYVVFLLLFSYMLLFRFDPRVGQRFSIHWTEVLTTILIICMFIEEVFCFCNMDTVMWYRQLRMHFGRTFKSMSAIGFVLYLVGFILRFARADTEEELTAARIVMAIDLEIWWLRSLAFVMAVPFLGPHLVAIGKMLKDLGFFMCIIAIVMLGYGVTSRSMISKPIADKLNTTVEFNGRSLLRQIVYPTYYLMYGEFKDEFTILEENPDAGWSIATQILLAAHMLFVNILLINLLIAIFSKRYDEVYEKTKNIWQSQRHQVIQDYFNTGPLFQPITSLCNLFHLCQMFYSWAFPSSTAFKKITKTRVFKMIPFHKSLVKDWYEFERSLTYEYAREEAEAVLKATSSWDLSDTMSKKDGSNGNRKTNQPAVQSKQMQEDLERLKASIADLRNEMRDSRNFIVEQFKAFSQSDGKSKKQEATQNASPQPYK